MSADKKTSPAGTDEKIEIDYGDYPHARGYEHEVRRDEHGVLRYRENKVIDWLVKKDRTLNEMAVLHARGFFSTEDMMEVYRLIGYSLDGFEEVWQEKDPATRTYTCQDCDNVVERGVALCEECRS